MTEKKETSKTLMLEGEAREKARAIMKLRRDTNAELELAKTKFDFECKTISDAATEAHVKMWTEMGELLGVNTADHFHLDTTYDELHGHVYLIHDDTCPGGHGEEDNPMAQILAGLKPGRAH